MGDGLVCRLCGDEITLDERWLWCGGEPEHRRCHDVEFPITSLRLIEQDR